MMSRRDLEQRIINHQRRLQKLKELQALHGFSVDPKIPLEIEDIEAELAALQAEWESIPTKPACPYRGLFAFREADAPFFFGREVFAEQLVEAVQRQPLVTVLGASGSGKSSVVFAGLIPQLRQEGHWLIADFRPGPDPFRALAATLLPLYETNLDKTDQMVKSTKLAAYLRQGELSLTDVISNILQTSQQAQPPLPKERNVSNLQSPHLLLIADQFEELYTLCPDADTRRRFLDLLIDSVQAVRNLPRSSAPLLPFTLLLTLRADFLGQALSYRPFADALQGADVKLGPMTHVELAEAIEKPAQKQNAVFEAGLVERILADVEDEPGNLPLLEFALTELWAQQSQSELTHTAYEAIGRVTGALTHYADEVFANLNQAEQAQTRRALIRMVQPGEGTEDTRRLVPQTELGEADWTLVQKLADARLVVTNRDAASQETVEVVHEALIQNWGRLRGWLDEDRAALRTHHRLTEAAEEWQRHKRDESYLYSGVRLAEAEEFTTARADDLNELERDFVQASVTNQQAMQIAARRRTQWIMAGLAAALVVFSVLTFLALQQRNNARYAEATAGVRRLEAEAAQAAAEIQRSEAERAKATAEAQGFEIEQQRRITLSRQLGAQSLNLLDDQLDLALLLSLEARRITDTIEARSSLLDGTVYNPHLTTFLQGHIGSVTSIAFSPDGQMLASSGGTGDNSVILWSIASHQSIGPPLKGHMSPIRGLAFSPNGQTLASGSEDGTIILWNIAAKSPISHTLSNKPGSVDLLTFSPDGQTLASASYRNNYITLWDVETGQPLVLPLTGHAGWGWSVAFSPDGQKLAWGSDDGPVILWDIGARQPFGQLLSGHAFSVASLAFSPDGQKLASGSCAKTKAIGKIGDCKQGEIRLWDVTSGQPIGQPLTGHSAAVVSLAFSPDSQILASSSDRTDRAIILWNVTNGQRIGQPLVGHTSNVSSLAFSPDGQILAAGYNDSSIILWDLVTDQLLSRSLAAHNAPVSNITFSPDGQTLASISSDDNNIILWDLATGQPLGQPITGQFDFMTTMAFSSDGATLAVGIDGDKITRWNIKTRQFVSRPLKGDIGFDDLTFSPDNSILASGSVDHSIHLWDVATGLPFGKPLTGHTNQISRIAFSPDGTLLASGSSDKTIILWNTATGQSIGTPLPVDTFWISSLAFSPDGQMLAASGSGSSVILLDIMTRQPIGQLLTNSTSQVTSIAFSPDGQMLASSGGDEKTIILWDVMSRQPIGQPLSGHTDRVTSVAFSPDGQTLATGSWDNTVKLWDINLASWQTRACARANRNLTHAEWQKYLGDETYHKTCPGSTEPPLVSSPTPSPLPIPSPTPTPKATVLEPTILSGHTDEVWGLAFSPSGKQVASASYDGTIRLWNPVTGKEVAVLAGHEGSVIDVAYSPDGTRLATASGTDKTARLWDLGTLNQIAILPSAKGGVATVNWSPDGQQLVTGDANGNVVIWDGFTGKALKTLKSHKDIVYTAIFSPDGEKLASASADGSAGVWDAKTGVALMNISGKSTIFAATFSPNGKFLATANEDGDARLWDTNTGKEWAILRGQLGSAQYYGRNGPVQDIVFNPRGDRVATACASGMVRVWNVSTGAELTRLKGHKNSVVQASFSPDGYRIITASGDGTARLWNATSGETVAILAGSTKPIYRAVFSPDGKLVATAGADELVRVYKVPVAK